MAIQSQQKEHGSKVRNMSQRQQGKYGIRFT